MIELQPSVKVFLRKVLYFVLIACAAVTAYFSYLDGKVAQLNDVTARALNSRVLQLEASPSATLAPTEIPTAAPVKKVYSLPFTSSAAKPNVFPTVGR